MKTFLLFVSIGFCLVEVHIQKSEAAIAVRKDPPPLCAYKCPNAYEPVCGLNPDGVKETFCNRCILNGESCVRNTDILLLHEGICKCQFIGKVCGIASDGTTQLFANICQLEAVNKCQDLDYVVTGIAVCGFATFRPILVDSVV